MDLLRLATAGSVDDGKSTLIGRLLLDAKLILEDQLEAMNHRNGDGPDLASVTDGLRAEREQGITIDVAYRFFQTDKRSFIIADTPGHERYTRNMVSGASTAELGLILIDARNGIVDQSRREPGDRSEHIRRVAHVARLLADAGVVSVVSLVSPTKADRRLARELHDAAGLEFHEVYVSTPVEECERRDPKGLYAKARAGKLPGFTGVDAPYEPPEQPEFEFDTSDDEGDDAVERLIDALAV